MFYEKLIQSSTHWGMFWFSYWISKWLKKFSCTQAKEQVNERGKIKFASDFAQWDLVSEENEAVSTKFQGENIQRKTNL